MANAHGCFLVLEGIDGAGTTLQVGALATALRARGHEVVTTHEPTDLEIGQLVRRSLQRDDALNPRSLALLFAADRLDHLARRIEPALAAGAVILSDRYKLSSLAYQSLDCPIAWVREINRHARAPDLTLFLDVPVEVAFARVRRRAERGAAEEERFDVPQLQRRVAANYHALLDDQDAALGEVARVDGTLAPERVTAALLDRCAQRGL